METFKITWLRNGIELIEDGLRKVLEVLALLLDISPFRIATPRLRALTPRSQPVLAPGVSGSRDSQLPRLRALAPSATSRSWHSTFRKLPRVWALAPSTPGQSWHLVFRDTVSISAMKWLMLSWKIFMMRGVSCVRDQCIDIE